MNLIFTAAICFVSVVEQVNSYRILGLFPTPCYSHQSVFRSLTLALNKRGHDLVVVTPNPINDSTLNNYTEIDISFGYDLIAGVNFIAQRETKFYDLIEQIQYFLLPLSDGILSHPDLQKLYAPHSDEKFDLLIIETLYSPSGLSLAKRFDVPVIGVASLGLTTNVNYAIGNPVLPSHPSNWEIAPNISQPLCFWQRLQNFISAWKYLYWFRTTYMSKQQALAQKYFGNDIPDLSDLEKNISLIFVNQQDMISHARPSAPMIIQIGGFHVSAKSTTLPKDLKKVLDEATEGFVYMSLGSTGKTSLLPNKTINQFIDGFSRLPYKVLFKFEDEFLSGKPDNVHIMKWVPQQAVLAHPNLKVFVYQGGLQSTEEAVANAVPLVGFPVFSDQAMQVDKMVSLGVAIKLEITAVDGKELYEAITTVANNNSYKERMLNLRSMMNDKPHDLLERAVWWTEYVIRHRGAPHLHSSTADEPWYRRQDMDVVAFISATSVLVLSFTIVILFLIVKNIYYSNGRSHDTSKKID